jgi:nucleoside-diphosphate-sugar epimerase
MQILEPAVKKILVTGSRGFIGQHLVTALERLNYKVYTADLQDGIDLCDIDTARNLPDVDIVFHAAAFNGTKYFYSQPYDVIRHNVIPTQNLLDRYMNRCEHFVFTGTCESYSGAVDTFGYPVPTDEKVPLVVNDIMNPRWSYGGSKILAELLCVAAYSQFYQPFTIIRYHNVYGPGQRDHFIPEFADRLLDGKTDLYGYENTRSFCYVDDAVNATLQLLDTPINGPINIGVDQEVTILDVANIIKKYLSVKQELVLHPAPTGSVSRRCPNIELLKSKIDYNPKVDLQSGIKKTLDALL